MNRNLIILLLTASSVAGKPSREVFGEVSKENTEPSQLQLTQRPFNYFNDCDDALKKGFNMSGVYRIKPRASFRPFRVWCDMESDGGGWTLIQARFDGLIGFFRSWAEYRTGFGSVDSEHWLGNNFMHQITENNDYQLKIEITGFQENEFAFAKYSPFRIGSEDENYKLYVGNFTGEGQISDSLTYHNGSMFTTKDKDNDSFPTNCATRFQSAWWFNGCFHVNLNGNWISKNRSLAYRGSMSPSNELGIHFRHAWDVDFYSLKRVEMKVRKMRRA